MTDWSLVISTTVGFMTAFATKVGDEFAKKTGEQLFLLVKKKLKDNKESQSVLSNFKKKPKRYRDALADIVTEKAQTDPNFEEEIRRLVGADLVNHGTLINVNNSVGTAISIGPNAKSRTTVQNSKSHK